MRCRGQNENVKHTAVGETEGESRETGAIGREKDDGISANWGKPAAAKAFCGVCWQIDAWKRGGQMARTLCTEGPKHPP